MTIIMNMCSISKAVCWHCPNHFRLVQFSSVLGVVLFLPTEMNQRKTEAAFGIIPFGSFSAHRADGGETTTSLALVMNSCNFALEK